MDDDLGPLLRAVLDEPVVVRFRHGLGEAQARLLDSLGATVVVDPDADRCVRFCGREECKVSAVTVRGWCRMYGCGEEPATDSEFCSGHQHAAGEPVGLEEVAAVGQVAESGSARPVGEPERAAVSSSPEPGPAQPVPSPEGEADPAGGGARYRPPIKWSREKVIAAIREVAEQVGHTPTYVEMRAAGYSSVVVNTTLRRLGATWAELVQEAGYEPNTRGSKVGRPKASGRSVRPDKGSEREPEAEDAGDLETAHSLRPVSSPAAGEAEAASRSDVLVRALALAERAFADAILEDTA